MNRDAPVAVEFGALGTTARVVVTRGAEIATARGELERVLDDVDAACSRFRVDSELMRVNRSPNQLCRVGSVFVEALDVALRAARLTNGHVDPTLGVAMRALGYDRDFTTLAKAGDASERVLPLPAAPDWTSVHLDREARTVRVPAGLELDLGATAKAYAADRAARLVHERVGGGVLVSLGGDVAVAGSGPHGGWAVRVTDDHRAGPAAPGETIAIDDGGIATSSTTARRWTRGDDELHHIIDPSTRQPAAGCWRTASVTARSCVDANTASTAAIVLGPKAPAWLSGLGLPARLVSVSGEVTRVGRWPEALVA